MNNMAKKPDDGDDLDAQLQHLQMLRVQAGLTQKEMARKLGLSQSQISRIEKNPSSIEVEQLTKWVKICAGILGVRMLAFPPALLILGGVMGFSLAMTNEKLRNKLYDYVTEIANHLRD